MTSDNTIAKDSAKYLSGTIGSRGVGLLRSFILPMLVSPVHYGLWRIVLIIWQYGLYLHLGTFEFMNRELPGLAARGQWEEHRLIRRTALWGSLFLATIGAAVLLLWSFVPEAQSISEQPWVLRFCAFGLIVQLMLLYNGVIFRSRSQFGWMSFITFANAFLGLLMAVAFTFCWGIKGLVAGMTLAMTIVGVGATVWSIIDSPVLRPRVYGSMVAQGIPLSCLPLMTTTIASVGQIVSASVLGLEQAGYYGIGLMLGTSVYAIPQALGIVLYPRYLDVFARTGDAHMVGRTIRKSLHVIAVATPLVICAGIIVVEPALRHFLPEYLPGLNAAYLQLVTMFFISFTTVLHHAILALRRHWVVVGIQGAALVLSCILALTGALTTGRVSDVALGVLIASALAGTAILVAVLTWTREPDDSVITELRRLFTPALVIGLTTLVAFHLDFGCNTLIKEIVHVVARLAAIACVGGIFAWRVWRSLSSLRSYKP